MSTGREILRRLFQGHLDLRSADEAAGRVIGADDDEARRRGRKRERQLDVVFGTVTVERYGYTKPAERSLFVLDGYLNLPPELYSFGLRRKVALEAAKVSFGCGSSGAGLRRPAADGCETYSRHPRS